MSKNSAPFFSIVIPTLNEEKYLPVLLSDIAAQSCTEYEVIIVDAHSEDKTIAVAQSFSKKMPLSTHLSKKKNAGAQRNEGAERARGEWVLFMDADNALPPYFLEGIKYQLSKQPETDVFTTLLRVKEPERLYKTIEQALNFGLVLIRLLDKPSAYGAFIGCKKSVLNQVHFDETLIFAEDGQFVTNCHQAGFTFSLFREPHFYYSMRRVKAQGTLSTLKISIPLLIRYALGDDLHGVKEYVMLGGKYYDTLLSREKSLFSTVQKYIQVASKQQLRKARAIVRSLPELDF